MTDSAHYSEVYQQLRTTGAAVRLERDVVQVKGPEAEWFLQGQVSQDVTKIETGSGAWSFVLQPHGKVDAFVRVSRLAPDVFVIDVDAGFGDAVIERLSRFKLRTKVDFERLAHSVLGLRGTGISQAVTAPQGGIALDIAWPGLAGVDLIGPDPNPGGFPIVGNDIYEALRIEAGMPRMRAELDERTIPAEACINDRTISFTKGCYTGQELVARIDSRGGNLARFLRGLIVEGDDLPPPGAKVFPIGRVTSSTKLLGTLTSVAYSPKFDAPVALAYIRRDVSPPATASVVWDDGSVVARIEKLPIVS